MGTTSQAVQIEDWASQARVKRVVKMRILRHVLGEGGLDPPGELIRERRRAAGEKLGILRKWRRARWVIV